MLKNHNFSSNKNRSDSQNKDNSIQEIRDNSTSSPEFSWEKKRSSQELQTFISRKLAELADVKIEL